MTKLTVIEGNGEGNGIPRAMLTVILPDDTLTSRIARIRASTSRIDDLMKQLYILNDRR